jgi:hypothetical protein
LAEEVLASEEGFCIMELFVCFVGHPVGWMVWLVDWLIDCLIGCFVIYLFSTV